MAPAAILQSLDVFEDGGPGLVSTDGVNAMGELERMGKGQDMLRSVVPIRAARIVPAHSLSRAYRSPSLYARAALSSPRPLLPMTPSRLSISGTGTPRPTETVDSTAAAWRA